MRGRLWSSAMSHQSTRQTLMLDGKPPLESLLSVKYVSVTNVTSPSRFISRPGRWTWAHVELCAAWWCHPTCRSGWGAAVTNNGKGEVHPKMKRDVPAVFILSLLWCRVQIHYLIFSQQFAALCWVLLIRLPFIREFYSWNTWLCVLQHQHQHCRHLTSLYIYTQQRSACCRAWKWAYSESALPPTAHIYCISVVCF